MRAAALHGGMIDKFAGDGALILFGVPDRRSPTTPPGRLACGRMLLDLVERWNAKRGFDPPLRIGIGIHTGEMFCGVVGDEDAARIHGAGRNRQHRRADRASHQDVDEPFLASLRNREAAGEGELWAEVAARPCPA